MLHSMRNPNSLSSEEGASRSLLGGEGASRLGTLLWRRNDIAMEGVVLITGAHGIGKTTVLKAVSSEVRISAYTAGDLIRRRRRKTELGSSETVPNIDMNQELLISEVDAILKVENVLLLDGHVVLLAPTRQFEPIPPMYFERLKVLGIIHLDSDARRIQRNLHCRGDTNISVELINENLLMERLYSPQLASQLDVPHTSLRLGDLETDVMLVAQAVEKIVEEQ
jgi:adenylate kinase